MTFVVTEGQLAALDRAPSSMPRTSVRLADDFTQDYAAIFRANPQVRTVISFLGRNIAQIKMPVYERISDDERRKVNDHPLSVLIRKPNPRMTRYRMFDALVNDMGIWDNSIWLKTKIGSDVKALFRLPVRQISPIGDSWLEADGYRFRGTKGTKDFTPDEVVHFRGYNPDDARWGVSPLETLRRILAEDYQAGLAREQLHRNGAQFAGYIKRPIEAPEWNDTAARQFSLDFASTWASRGSQAGGTPILEEGMEYVANGVSPKELQYIEARKLTREEIAAAFHIPLPMVQLLENATFSNITEQHKQLYQDTLGPWLQMIQEEIELQLMPDFDTTGKFYVEFNMAEKLKGSFVEQADSYQKAAGGPYLTRNEVRAMENRPPIDGGDELVMPLNVTAGGQASPSDSAPKSRRLRARRPGAKARADADAEDEAQKVLQKFFRRQRSVVLSALGAKAAGDWWDTERWDTELADDLYDLAMKVSASVAAQVLEAEGLAPDIYDPEQTAKFLAAVAESRAGAINSTTLDAIEAALASEVEDDTPAAVFDEAETLRAVGGAVALITTFSAFGTTEAAKQGAGDTATKTWVVTSRNPRSSHAAMDGETVGINESFSNGANWPGDPVLGAEGVAGCQCDIEVNFN